LEKLLKTSIEQLSIVNSLNKSIKSYFGVTLEFLPLSKITPIFFCYQTLITIARS
jgi:hypothetical protein